MVSLGQDNYLFCFGKKKLFLFFRWIFLLLLILDKIIISILYIYICDRKKIELFKKKFFFSCFDCYIF